MLKSLFLTALVSSSVFGSEVFQSAVPAEEGQPIDMAPEPPVELEPEDDLTQDMGPLARRLAGAWLLEEAMLKEHNHYRSLTAQGLTPNQPGASYMEEMSWDYTLQDMAMDQAMRCSSRSGRLGQEYARLSGKKGYFSISQSRYWRWGRDVGSDEYVVSSVRSWYETHQAYDYETRHCAPGGSCRLYTNVVWATTRFVGCGANVCNGRTFVICNYLTGRSSRGKPYPKVTASKGVCSGCPAERQTCSNSLCSGAPVGTPTSAPTGRPTTTSRPTPRPTQPGEVAACRGIRGTVWLASKFGASTSGVTCADYKAAFTSVFPCIQSYSVCEVADYPGYRGWARVKLSFQVSRSVWSDLRRKTESRELRTAMRKYLEATGFVWGSR